MGEKDLDPSSCDGVIRQQLRTCIIAGPEAAREQDYGIEVVDLHLFYGCVPLELEAEVDQIVFVNWPKRIRLYSWGGD